jgi:hypothetical protein
MDWSYSGLDRAWIQQCILMFMFVILDLECSVDACRDILNCCRDILSYQHLFPSGMSIAQVSYMIYWSTCLCLSWTMIFCFFLFILSSNLRPLKTVSSYAWWRILCNTWWTRYFNLCPIFQFTLLTSSLLNDQIAVFSLLVNVLVIKFKNRGIRKLAAGCCVS